MTRKTFPPPRAISLHPPPLLLLPALLRTADIGGAERRATLIKLLDVLTSSGEERGGGNFLGRVAVSQCPPSSPLALPGDGRGKKGREVGKERKRAGGVRPAGIEF